MNKTKIKGYEITISFLANKTSSFKNAYLYLNLNNEDDWAIINDEAMASYEKIIVKLEILETKKTKFLFLKNTNIVFENKTILINTFSERKFYKKSNNKVMLKDKLKEVNKRIDHLDALQKIGLNIDQFIELKELKEKQYELKMQQLLNLIEEDTTWVKK
ncbi:MSC_0621 family F1-like ATPase epsilon subunit [Metamycoplasma buccale]|uniref:MSC_0621 family F1-like ATPase epsilon subunit n=1 Tax=Metamycoplasma buccale TaxID=55602 RepID=UPI00398EB1B7